VAAVVLFPRPLVTLATIIAFGTWLGIILDRWRAVRRS
jgi:uncharacterized membrane protein YdjX (TVP38/TMEM64 family)